MAEPGLSLAGLLRQLRAEARLTQEELAEAAQVSSRSVSALERGIHRTAQRRTALLLADALGLADPARALFVAAARGQTPPAEVLTARQEAVPGSFTAAARGLPRDLAGFTGRRADVERLTEALSAADPAVGPIHAIDGMAGIGKTAFAVHVAHRLAGSFPDGQFFLPLHGHTPGQRPVDPSDALASLLLIAGTAAARIPPGLDARAAFWRDRLADQKVLLLLDDAASHEQVRPLLPGTAGSLALITSRRRLTALEDATVITLDPLPPAEAAALLSRLAARPGLSAADPAVDQITRLCGHLPLAIALLAGQLRHHPAWSCGGLAVELAAARDRLALMHAENLSVAAAFDLSYQDLAAGSQRLFRRLGLIPGPSFDDQAAAALDGVGLDQARRQLGELYDHHLIAETVPGRYRLHDLMREHARTLAGGDQPDSAAATGRLLDYYAQTVLAASKHSLFWRTARSRPATVAREFSTRQQAVAWVETERQNLHAAVSRAAAAGQLRHAVAIAASMGGFLLTHSPPDQATASFRIALAAARQAGDRQAEAATLKGLGAAQWLVSDHDAAGASLTQAARLYGDIGDRLGQAFALCHLGLVQQATAGYPAAAASYRQALVLARAVGDRLAEGGALTGIGVTQRLTGDYPAAAASQRQALDLCRGLGYRLGQAWVLVELGILQRLDGDLPAAASRQQQAIELFRDLGERFGEAGARNELGLVRQLTGDYRAAADRHQEALDLYRRFGHRYGEAETLNHLGQLASLTASHASQTSHASEARRHHTQALTVARAIGAPLEEARALEGIGATWAHEGDAGQAAAHRHRALAIYERIGAPQPRR